jgi:hypothetical protein
VDVTVVTPSGTSATGAADKFTYSAAPQPAVTSVTPNTGSATGGATVTVLGSGFTGASAVNFNATAATSFTVLSDNALTAVVPAGSVGTVDITVVAPGGTSATGAADHYTYTAAPPAPAVTSLTPTGGGSGGGTVVIVTGSGFTGATGVSFGAYAGASFFVNGDTQLTAVAPAQAAATVDVQVATPSGTSPAVAGDHFTYSAAAVPAVTGVSPNTGPTAGGTNVTVSSGFTGAAAVAFGGVPATSFAVVADGTIFAVAPAEAAGTVDVKVTTPSGTSSAVGADQFTFAADAGLTSVSGINISATAGVPLSGPLVASFTDADTSGTASQFTALISWGDGHSTIGVVQFNGYDGLHRPQFKVQGGTVIYASAGTYTITIAIYDVGGASASTTATASVTNPGGAPTRPHPVAVGTTATATHGVPFRGSVASFKGSIPGGTAASYTVSISWGNGITTAGTVRPTGNNTFSVFGGVTYAQAGTYTVSITITDSFRGQHHGHDDDPGGRRRAGAGGGRRRPGRRRGAGAGAGAAARPGGVGGPGRHRGGAERVGRGRLVGGAVGRAAGRAGREGAGTAGRPRPVPRSESGKGG